MSGEKDELLRGLLPAHDNERIRRELLDTIEDDVWMCADELMNNVAAIGGELRQRPRAMDEVLDKLAEEGLVEIGGRQIGFTEKRLKLWRLTGYGQIELERLGGATEV